MKLKNARVGMEVQVKKGKGLNYFFEEGAIGTIDSVGEEDLYINFHAGTYHTTGNPKYPEASSWFSNAGRVRKVK